MPEVNQALIVPAGGGEWSSKLGHPARTVASGERTGGTYSFSWASIPEGQGPPPHRHDFAEGVHVLKGEITFTAGNRTVGLPAGGFLAVGGGTAHSFKNLGTEEAEVLVLTGPSASRAIEIDLPEDAFRAEPEVVVRRPGEGPAIAVVGDLYTFLAFGEDTGGRFGLWDAVIPPGGGPPPHIQTREHEGFYVIDGELAFQADGQRVVAGPGTFLNIPPGVLHSFRNEGDRPARQLIWVAPAGLEKLFRETGQVVEDRSAPIPPPSPEGIEKLLAVAPRYGVEVRVPGSH